MCWPSLPPPTTITGNLIVDGGNTFSYATTPNQAGDVQLQGDIQFLGANSWILHTPDDVRKSLFIAPGQPQAWNLGTRFWPTGDVSFSRDVLVTNRVLIGSGALANVGSMALAVDGKIGARAMYVRATGVSWPDYVFRPGYRLRPLAAVGRYVKLHHHLPELPAAATVQAQGLDLGQMNALLLKKVEELTLYLLALQQANQDLQQRVSRLEK